jgi:hypothetical protein
MAGHAEEYRIIVIAKIIVILSEVKELLLVGVKQVLRFAQDDNFFGIL